jgi:hypothetical protein
MSYTSPELKLRTMAVQNATLQADLGGSNPATFRWYDRQLLQNEIGKLVGNGACVRVARVSTMRGMNQGGIQNLSWPRIQIDVLDFDAEKARSVANDVIDFMGTINLCTNQQFDSPTTSITSNPSQLLNQRAGMIPNPQSPSGPIYVESLDFRIANIETLSIS